MPTKGSGDARPSRRPEKSVAAKKAQPVRTPAKKAGAAKVPAKKVPAKKVPAKKVLAKKVPQKKVPAEHGAPRATSAGTTDAGIVRPDTAAVDQVAAERRLACIKATAPVLGPLLDELPSLLDGLRAGLEESAGPRTRRGKRAFEFQLRVLDGFAADLDGLVAKLPLP